LTLIGIVVAMTAEARSLIPQVIAHSPFVHGSETPWVEVSGIGPIKARQAARKLVQKDAKGLVSWGIAAGLSRGLSPGALVLPEKVLAVDGSVYKTDVDWHGRLCALLSGHVDLHTGLLAESSTVLTSPSEKSTLSNRTRAIAADMESAAVAAVAREAGVPFMAIRAVADRADRTIPESILSGIDEFGRVTPFGLIKGLARRPAELFALIGLGRDFRAARATLETVARLAGSNLLGP
jgi:adenosylhomocysteine nucleosidase